MLCSYIIVPCYLAMLGTITQLKAYIWHKEISFCLCFIQYTCQKLIYFSWMVKQAEGLLVELNWSTCYNFIEQCVGCILGKLAAMESQRFSDHLTYYGMASVHFSELSYFILVSHKINPHLHSPKHGSEAMGSNEQRCMHACIRLGRKFFCLG